MSAFLHEYFPMVAEYLTNRTPTFYLSLAAPLLALMGCIYLVVEWFRHRRLHTFMILWAAGFFSLYLFQLPAILANAGAHFVLTDFNPFFAISAPLTVFGLYLIYAGIASLLQDEKIKKIGRYLLFLAIACFVFVAFYFAKGLGFENYAPLFIAIFVFYLPTEIALLWALWRWYRMKRFLGGLPSQIGIASIFASVSLGVARDFIIIPKILSYPPHFWFVAYSSFTELFVLQAISLVLIMAGFFLVHKGFTHS